MSQPIKGSSSVSKAPLPSFPETPVRGRPRASSDSSSSSISSAEDSDSETLLPDIPALRGLSTEPKQEYFDCDPGVSEPPKPCDGTCGDPNCKTKTAHSSSSKSAVTDPPSSTSSSTPSPASSTTTVQPSLDQQAQLSYPAMVGDWSYRLFWGTLTAPKRALFAVINWGGDKAVTKIVEIAASKGVSVVIDPQPDTPLKKLRDLLFALHAHASKNLAIDARLKTQSIEALKDFLPPSRQKVYFAESFDSAGYRVGLNYAQQKQFETLLNALEKDLPISGTFVKRLQELYEFIDQSWQYQRAFHVSKIAQQYVGEKPTDAATSASPIQPKKLREHRLFTVPPQQTAAKQPPKNPIPLIITEIDKLKSLGFKIGLALLVLPDSILSKSNQGTGELLAGLIKKADETLDPLKNSNEIFQDLLFTELDNSNLSFFQRASKKLAIKLLAPCILFMVDHVLDKSRDMILYLIGLPPEKRIDLIVKIFIEPSREFISKLQSEYISLAKNPESQTTVDKAISEAIGSIRIKDRNGSSLTPKDLIKRLVGSFINQYSPSFDWSRSAISYFEKRSDTKTPIVSIWFLAWSYLARVAHLVWTPFGWGLHVIVRQTITRLTTWWIHSKLQDTTEASWDFGRLALHSLYKTLYDRLVKLNREEKTSASDDKQKKLAIEQTPFVDHLVQDNISQLLGSFLKLLSIQGSDFLGLHSNLATNNGVEQTKVAGLDLVYGPGIQKATEGIIQGLQGFLEKETFSRVICEVLQDIRLQSLRVNASGSERSLAHLENAFYIELKDAIQHIIEDVIDEKLDPVARIQQAANLFIDGIKFDVEQFQTHFSKVSALTPATLRALEEIRDQFLNDAFRRRSEQAEADTNPSAREHIRSIGSEFHHLRKPIYEKMEELAALATERLRLEQTTEQLNKLIAPLGKAIAREPLANATEFYKELELTLQKIKNNSYPFTVQRLISTLQGQFNTWKTEVAKQENQALLNSTIETLYDEVTSQIEAHQAKGRELTLQMSQISQEAKTHVTALSDWSKKLTYFSCLAESREVGALQKLFSKFVQDNVPSLILKQLNGFFIFLGRDHNMKGLLWYMIKSYLELPAKSSQEIKRIVDKVISEAQIPSATPVQPPK